MRPPGVRGLRRLRTLPKAERCDMRRFALAAVLCLSGAAHGADIFSVIPEDAVVVVVARNYDVGVGSLRRFADGCVPSTLPAGAERAGLPFLGQLTELRGILDKTEQEYGGSASDALGLVVFVSEGGKTRAVTLEPVAEGPWQAANASSIRQTPRGAQVVRGNRQFFFRFNGEYLVSSRDAEAVSAYEKCLGKGLSGGRRSALEQLLQTHMIAANVSAPSLAKVWTSKQPTAAEAVAAAMCEHFKQCFGGTELLPLPEKFLSTVASDYLTNSDETYIGIDVTNDRVEFSGSAGMGRGSRYQAIIAEQAGGGEEACRLAPNAAVAAVCLSLEGEALWSYARGLVGPYVGGVLKDQTAIPNSLKAGQQVFDDFRSKVGLKRAAFALVCAEDGRHPVPVLAAEVADAKAAITALSNSITSLYGDAMLRYYGKQRGLYLGVPVKEQADADAATVKMPFSVSATDPVRAAMFKDVFGAHIVWRFAAMEQDAQQVVVAGQFTKSDMVKAVCSSFPAGTEGMVGEFKPGDKAIGGAFVNLPLLAAARMKAAAKIAGTPVSGYQALPVVPGCAVRAYATEEGVAFEGMIPMEQVRAAFTVLGKAAPKVVKPAEEPQKDTSSREKDTGERRRVRSGFGRREDD